MSIGRQELTVFLGELYAGRFPVSFGKDPSPVEGTFEIVDRRRDRTYYGTGGKVIPAGDPRNPYGGYWLNLGQHCVFTARQKWPAMICKVLGALVSLR